MKTIQVFFKSRLERTHYINIKALSEIEVLNGAIRLFGLQKHLHGLTFEFKQEKSSFNFAEALATDNKKTHFVVYLNDQRKITEWQ